MIGAAARCVLEGDHTAGSVIREWNVSGAPDHVQRVSGAFLSPHGIFPASEATLRRQLGDNPDVQWVPLAELFPSLSLAAPLHGHDRWS